MRIELTWPRPDTDDRTLTLVLPGLPARLRAVVCAEPVISAAAAAVAIGAGPLTRAALPYALRFARHALDIGTTDPRPRHDTADR
ncbi:hypothetical protein ABT115_20760 [Streptomyces sp. NPDC001832]|uniref:hypothetical protein n=1 Tax=Streptomyces sp. NPDC001832 TaxID=3154527 RepID=UPI00331F8F3F